MLSNMVKSGNPKEDQFESPMAPEKTPWLSAWKNPVAGIKAYEGCMAFVDLHDDGDYRFVIANDNRKMVIHHGVKIEKEVPLVDAPIAITVFYPEIS